MTPAEVRTARKTLGLTQSQLGEIFGVGKQAVSWWEQDDAPDNRGIPDGSALALRYMVRYGVPEVVFATAL